MNEHVVEREQLVFFLRDNSFEERPSLCMKLYA
jgi:hypothetical protein